MIEPVSLTEMKRHLKVEDYDGDDSYIGGLTKAARRSCEKHINQAVADLGDPDDVDLVGQAMRMLVAGWYANREAVSSGIGAAPVEMPLAVTWLLGTIWRPTV